MMTKTETIQLMSSSLPEMAKTDRLKLHNKAQLVADLSINLANNLLLVDPNASDATTSFNLIEEAKNQLAAIEENYRIALNKRLHKRTESSGI